MNIVDIHICDDTLFCQLGDLDAVQAASSALRQQTMWREIVPGLESVAVQFDPAQITPDKASDLLREQLLQPLAAAVPQMEPITVPVCYDKIFAPDQEWIADKLGMSPATLIAWHNNLSFTVTMLGFMPGFAYLRCQEEIAKIGRLPKPRQKVGAGSIGIIGDQSCIYSFSSPGGWPIIGRTPVHLFRPENNQPALLSANQVVSFRSIDKAEFEKIAEEQYSRELGE
ncbi:allophanate hydrolase subunit 1 [Sphingorhabdus sp. EL138]|uniref:5-oxoprolinase subunit B family protein n=1 Tax=Sphingorhabdus sp. EL138 TaxID=2073156 RepID=UPI0013A5A673|nr:allophanate hydrolase subunit 1 [Sphingorhabdus sp. EL138]